LSADLPLIRGPPPAVCCACVAVANLNMGWWRYLPMSTLYVRRSCRITSRRGRGHTHRGL